MLATNTLSISTATKLWFSLRLAIGAFIHPDGSFAKARKEFFEHKKNPTKVNGKGQEAEINTYSSCFSAEEVDGEFFSLQKEYRTLQAELNKFKAKRLLKQTSLFPVILC